jgi:hypothetical protein
MSNLAKVGHHYIDQSGRVVEAEPKTHGCRGCIYSKGGRCNHKYPNDIYCHRIIFKEVTDEN